MLSLRSLSALTIAVATAAAITLPSPASASAITAIDQFIITRSNTDTAQFYEGQTVFYRDVFSDGAEPPAGGSFFDGSAGTYDVLGSYPVDAESDGKLGLDSSFGGPFTNANGGTRTLQRSTLLTSFDPTNRAGLKEDFHTFSVFGLFDLTIPPLPRDGYGIAVSDGGPAGATESIDLFVRREENGSLVIRFQEQDFLNRVVNTLELDALVIPTGADQIELQLRRDVLGTNALTASYRFWDDGEALGLGSFTTMSTAASFFTNNGWARGIFFAVEGTAAVPEPNTLALLLIGSACALAVSKRRRREGTRK
jgi:hypothetical protein